MKRFLAVVTLVFILAAPSFALTNREYGDLMSITLVLMIVCLADAIWLGLGWLVFVYYFIAYKQLFGYGWWGTI